jgi:uncharacterized protein YgbK (DUF1537 family)
VINAQSRLLPPEAGRAVFEQIGRSLTGKSVIFVKVDSALRGPVGAELEGLIQAVGRRRVIVAPAIPRIGRTTQGGRQYDQGVPIDQTAYASDPVSPIRSANLAELLGQTGHVDCSICDAETDEDLDRIVDQVLNGSELVLVGSLGLAGALLRRVEKQPSEAGSWRTIRGARRPLLVCGSMYARTQTQIQYAVAQHRARVLDIPAGEAHSCGQPAAADGLPLIVRLHPRPAAASACPPSTILPRFAGVVRQLVGQLRPDGLGIIGGETAVHFLNALEVGCVVVYGRACEVIAYGAMEDGSMQGCRLVTKGGSVGPEDAVVQMMDHLLGGNGERL